MDNACKVIAALQGLDKEYKGEMLLHKDASLKDVKKIASSFIGKIRQTPPVRSAVSRREREREIYDFKITGKKGRVISFHVACQAGTYIRLLCHELGQRLGTGAHMTLLRRTRVGPFTEKSIVKKEELEEIAEKNQDKLANIVLPVEAAVEHLKHIIIKDSAVSAVVNGSPLYTAGISRVEKGIRPDEKMAILTLKGELVALATSKMTSGQMLRHGKAAKTDRVIMGKGVYPKMKK